VTDHHPTAEDHVKALEAYFWNLVVTYATREPGDGFMEAKRILEPVMGNLLQNHLPMSTNCRDHRDRIADITVLILDTPIG
jgi:hypothetical protein